MVWACGKNGRVPYGQKGVDGEVSEGRVRGRPRLGWMDGVKVALGNRGMTVDAARQCAKDCKAVFSALLRSLHRHSSVASVTYVTEECNYVTEELSIQLHM